MLNNNDEPKNKLDNKCDPTNEPQATIGGNGYNRDGESESAATASAQPDKLLNIPQELCDRAQWCIAGDDKAPFIGTEQNLFRAKVNEGPWLTFEQASSIAAKLNRNIGFVLTKDDPFVCIDLDIKDGDSKDAKGNYLPQHQWTPIDQLNWYQGIVLAAQSYTEMSAGGKGIHVWVKGEFGEGRRGHGIEVYSQERFIIFTGKSICDVKYQHLLGRVVPLPVESESLPIQERQQLIESIVSEFSKAEVKIELEEVEAELTDEVLWEKAATAGNSEKFIDLCNGKWQQYGFPSQSEADLALMSIFTFYSKSNAQCRRMFRQTALGKRDKAVKNDVYIDRTLKIIRSRQEREAGETKDISIDLFAKDDSPTLMDKPLRQFLAEKAVVEFTIDDVLKRGWLYSFTGYTGSGKTGIAVNIALHVATAKPLAGHETLGEPVLYIASENPDDVRNRFHAALADGRWPQNVSDKIFIVDQSFLLEKKISDLEQIIESRKPCLVIVDTDQAISLSGKDNENDNGVRIEHAKRLRKLCAKNSRPTVLDLCHPSNANKDKPTPRGGSSFLSEIDGNIYCTAKGEITTVCSDENKFRGNPFQLRFSKVGVKHPAIIDSKGREISTPVFAPINTLTETPHPKDDRLLALEIMKTQPERSQTEWAIELNWLTGKGEPNKSKISKVLKGLSCDGLVVKEGVKYRLTPKGKALLKE